MSAPIVEQLRAWGPLIASGYEVPSAGQPILEAADIIEALMIALQDVMDILCIAESNASGNGAEWEYVSPRITACRAAIAKAKP
jgi:hypothetical protein